MGATSKWSSRDAVAEGEEYNTHFHSNASQDGDDVEGEVRSSRMCTILLPLYRRSMPPLASSSQRWPTITTPASSWTTSAEAAIDEI